MVGLLDGDTVVGEAVVGPCVVGLGVMGLKDGLTDGSKDG